MIFAKAL